MFEEIPVFFDGEICGSLWPQKCGRFWRISGLCAARNRQVLRAYLMAEPLPISLGVALPQDGGVWICRMVSAEQVELTHIREAILLPGVPAGYLPWQGMLAGIECRGICSDDGERKRIFLPLAEKGFSPMALICLFQPVMLEGRWYLSLEIGPDGEPIVPDTQ